MSISPSSSSPRETTLADLVTLDSRAAAVFDRLGLDYCCHGHQTLMDAATRKGLSVQLIEQELSELGAREDHTDRVGADTDLATLTEYIVSHHHQYVREAAPQIAAWLNKLVSRHGGRHPELAAIRAEFDALSLEMASHMLKEETMLFPFIDALAAAERTETAPPPGPFGTVRNPVRLMEHEHQEAAEHLATIRRLSEDFQPPPDACTTYRLCYDALARFEADLHRHVHLENHIVFPRAVALESALG